MDKDQIDRILATLEAREVRLQEMSEALANKDSMIEKQQESMNKQQESMNKLLEKVESLTTVQQQLPGGANNAPQGNRLLPVRSLKI